MKAKRLLAMVLCCALFAASVFYTWAAVATWQGDAVVLLLLSVDVVLLVLLARSARTIRASRAAGQRRVRTRPVAERGSLMDVSEE
jgi:hypothetical protein